MKGSYIPPGRPKIYDEILRPVDQLSRRLNKETTYMQMLLFGLRYLFKYRNIYGRLKIWEVEQREKKTISNVSSKQDTVSRICTVNIPFIL